MREFISFDGVIRAAVVPGPRSAAVLRRLDPDGNAGIGVVMVREEVML